MQFQDFTFGVEIECYVPRTGDLYTSLAATGLRMSRVSGSRHSVTPGWKIVPDVSLDGHTPAGYIGVEIVSPILLGEDGIAQTVKAMDCIKAFGGKVNKACGLHVHVGAQNATALQLRNLAKMFVKYEHHFDTLCPESRRNNRFAASNLSRAAGLGVSVRPLMVAAAFARLDTARSASGLATIINGGYDTRQHYTSFRYYKLNYQSLASHGTVEFRQAAGTVESRKAAAWIRLVVGMVASAFTVKAVALQDDPSFSKLMRKVDSPTAEYLRARRVALNSGVELED